MKNERLFYKLCTDRFILVEQARLVTASWDMIVAIDSFSFHIFSIQCSHNAHFMLNNVMKSRSNCRGIVSEQLQLTYILFSSPGSISVPVYILTHIMHASRFSSARSGTCTLACWIAAILHLAVKCPGLLLVSLVPRQLHSAYPSLNRVCSNLSKSISLATSWSICILSVASPGVIGRHYKRVPHRLSISTVRKLRTTYLRTGPYCVV